jgi:Putative DNA-binding domain
MSIVTKPLTDITVTDLEELRDREARETSELEFKGCLPFKAQKGQPETADRWITRGDRIGDYARDQLLAELVAFANAEGGTLILGLQETQTEPRRAERLEALPRCEDLARRLADACEDVIEPRLSYVLSKGVVIDDGGAGYVILRVGRSLNGPHRLKSDGQFYIRRGERAATMTVREIKDLTLELARTGDRQERAFKARQEICRREFERLLAISFVDQPHLIAAPLIIRSTALPVVPIQIPRLTLRPELWWRGRGFQMQVHDQHLACDFPAREFDHTPRVRLRGFNASIGDADRLSRLLLDNGLIELTFTDASIDTRQRRSSETRNIYIGWIVGLLAGTLSQIQHLRQQLAHDGMEFGLELEIWSAHPALIKLKDHDWDMDSGKLAEAVPLTLPRLSVRSIEDFDPIINQVVEDLWNASGQSYQADCKVPWGTFSLTAA